MSKFLTTLAVDLSPLLEVLPKGAHQHSLTFNAQHKCLELLWEHDELETGLTVAVPFELEGLAKRTLPTGVKHKPKAAVKADGKEQMANGTAAPKAPAKTKRAK